MSAAISDADECQHQYLRGSGWQAVVSHKCITVSVYPDGDIADAIEAIISPPLRRYWTKVWIEEDRLGRDIYQLVRGPAELV